MHHITDSMVDSLVDPKEAQRILHDAFSAFGAGAAAMQTRVRTEAEGVKLSTLGAVIPGQGVVGAKVYTTIKGQFSFVIVLFCARTGVPLATLEAGAITRLRTAACSVIVGKRLAVPSSKRLGLFGAGTQGIEHAVQFSQAFPIEEIWIQDPKGATPLFERLAERTGTQVRAADAADIAAHADILITASRSTTPLFRGDELRPGTFIAAIGSSLPHTRELDDATLAKARAVVVEWKTQSFAEAGDLIQAAPALHLNDKTYEVPDVLNGTCARVQPDDVFIYKSVGVGLEDIALAGYAYRQFIAGLADAAA